MNLKSCLCYNFDFVLVPYATTPQWFPSYPTSCPLCFFFIWSVSIVLSCPNTNCLEQIHTLGFSSQHLYPSQTKREQRPDSLIQWSNINEGNKKEADQFLSHQVKVTNWFNLLSLQCFRGSWTHSSEGLSLHLTCLALLLCGWVRTFLAVDYYRDGVVALDPLPHHHKAACRYTYWDQLTTRLLCNNCWPRSLLWLRQMCAPSPQCQPLTAVPMHDDPCL